MLYCYSIFLQAMLMGVSFFRTFLIDFQNINILIFQSILITAYVMRYNESLLRHRANKEIMEQPKIEKSAVMKTSELFHAFYAALRR